MGVYSDVDCCEVHGTKQWSLTQQGFEASVSLQVESEADASALVANVVGSKSWPTNAAAIAISATVKPLGAVGTTDGQEIDYDTHIVEVKYSDNKDGSDLIETTSPDGADRLSETIDGAVDYITLDYKRFRWITQDGDTLLEAEAPGKREYSETLVRTHYNVVTIPDNIFDDCGGVNEDSYASAILGFTYPAETLLLGPPNLSRTIKADGSKRWTMRMTFHYKPTGWNKFFNGKTGTYDVIVRASNGSVVKPYTPVDFSNLLF